MCCGYVQFHQLEVKVPNITISLDEKLLRSGRQYAEKHGTSVNALIRGLLEKTGDKRFDGLGR